MAPPSPLPLPLRPAPHPQSTLGGSHLQPAFVLRVTYYYLSSVPPLWGVLAPPTHAQLCARAAGRGAARSRRTAAEVLFELLVLLTPPPFCSLISSVGAPTFGVALNCFWSPADTNNGLDPHEPWRVRGPYLNPHLSKVDPINQQDPGQKSTPHCLSFTLRRAALTADRWPLAGDQAARFEVACVLPYGPPPRMLLFAHRCSGSTAQPNMRGAGHATAWCGGSSGHAHLTPVLLCTKATQAFPACSCMGLF